MRPWKGVPGGLISEDAHRPKDVDFAGGYLLQSIGVMPLTDVQQLARTKGLFGRALTDHMAAYNRVARINFLGDCLPCKESYVELSVENDARGLPKPRVHFSEGENERRMTDHSERLMGELWRDAGATEVWSFRRYAHTIGACRMPRTLPARWSTRMV